MELSSVHVHHTTTFTLFVLFCLFWPFIILSALPRRDRSAGPVAAALVPIALFTAEVWIGLIDTVRGMPLSGGWSRVVIAAGIAESFSALYAAAFFVAAVIVFTAIRLHRPFADRITATLFALLMIDIAVARIAVATLMSPPWWRYATAAIAGGIVALLIAIIAAVWTFRAGRGRVVSRALPYGITIMLAVAAIVGVIVWQTVQQYRAIAIYG